MSKTDEQRIQIGHRLNDVAERMEQEVNRLNRVEASVTKLTKDMLIIDRTATATRLKQLNMLLIVIGAVFMMSMLYLTVRLGPLGYSEMDAQADRVRLCAVLKEHIEWDTGKPFTCPLIEGHPEG